MQKKILSLFTLLFLAIGCNSEGESSGGGLFANNTPSATTTDNSTTNSSTTTTPTTTPAPTANTTSPTTTTSNDTLPPPAPEGPEITNLLEPINGTYAEGGNLIFQIEFEEAVLAEGDIRLILDIGGNTRYATLTGGNSTSALVFSYTVLLQDDDLNGLTLSQTTIDLNGGSLKSIVDNADAKIDFATHLDSLEAILIDNSSGVTAPNQVLNLATAPTTENDTLAISWSVPADNGTAITNYSLQYRQQGTTTWVTMNPSPTTNSSSISGLSAGVTYEFRVAANNGLLGTFSTIQTAEIFDVMSLDPIAWLDATNVNGDGTSPEDGSSIASWVDLTGSATNAEETDINKQPVIEYNAHNGLPAVRFDNKDRGLQGTFTRENGENLTFVIVGQFDEGHRDKCLFEFRGPGNQRGFFIDRRYGSNTMFSPELTKGGFQIWRIEDDGDDAIITENKLTELYNGATLFGTDFVGTGNYVLGDDTTGNNRMYGYIAEFLVFDRALTEAEINTLETYLQNKWGTP